ncbi:MAG: sulfite exporter TauE/SafE family protein [Flavobacteriales bacterium]|nr:sulfite exporter TauE/SafE family protein [Flavobacteriales bacterium]
MELLAFFALLLIAEVLGTVGGFGSSMLVMPLAGLFLPFEQALGLTAVFHVFSNAAKMFLFRQAASKRLLLWLGIPAVIGVLVGARLTFYLDQRVLALCLGIVLTTLALFLLAKRNWRLRATDRNAAVGGLLSGSIAGLAGTGGAIRGITLAAFDLEKLVFVSTSAWIDMGVDLSRSVVYAAQGYVTTDMVAYMPAMAVASLVGSWLGKRLLLRTPQERFRTIVLILVLVMGVLTTVQAFYGATH